MNRSGPSNVRGQNLLGELWRGQGDNITGKEINRVKHLIETVFKGNLVEGILPTVRSRCNMD
jgi:hypothetical protein